MATRAYSSLTYCWNGRCTSMTPESHRIRIVDNIIWYDIWKGVSTQRLRDDDVLEYLLDDLSNAGLSTDDIKNYSWIVNTGWEGHSAEDIEHFRVLLLRHGLPETSFWSGIYSIRRCRQVALSCNLFNRQNDLSW